MGGSSCPNWARPIIADSHAEFTLKLGSCLMCQSGKKHPNALKHDLQTKSMPSLCQHLEVIQHQKPFTASREKKKTSLAALLALMLPLAENPDTVRSWNAVTVHVKILSKMVPFVTFVGWKFPCQNPHFWGKSCLTGILNFGHLRTGQRAVRHKGTWRRQRKFWEMNVGYTVYIQYLKGCPS